jgi:hypothetical protein
MYADQLVQTLISAAALSSMLLILVELIIAIFFDFSRAVISAGTRAENVAR